MLVLVRETVLLPMSFVSTVPTVVPTTETCELSPLNANLTWLPLNASFVAVPTNEELTLPDGVMFTYPVPPVVFVFTVTDGVNEPLADSDVIVWVCVPTPTSRPIWLTVAFSTPATAADVNVVLWLWPPAVPIVPPIVIVGVTLPLSVWLWDGVDAVSLTFPPVTEIVASDVRLMVWLWLPAVPMLTAVVPSLTVTPFPGVVLGVSVRTSPLTVYDDALPVLVNVPESVCWLIVPR